MTAKVIDIDAKARTAAEPWESGPPPDMFDDEHADDNGPTPAIAKFYKLTDSGNAERLVAMFGDRIRYCSAWGKWLVWDDARWCVDRRGAVELFSKDVARSIYGEAARATSDDARKAIVQWARKSESRAARSAMVELAGAEPGVAVLPEELDAAPMLLNTPSGTIDLKTGAVREHDRADLITKCTAARFDKGTKSSALWERILGEACGGDLELVAFVQRAAGYSITALTSEEKLFMPIGPTASGKSTIIQAIRETLGDYARTADFEAFLVQKNAGGPKNEIARLAGARIVVSIEVDKGKRLAQGLIKTLTGGDEVSARFLYQEAFEFRPTFKLWLVANDAPVVSDDDEAIWRRIVRLPFEHTVPAARRDPKVKAELIDVEKSGPAILAWLVEGCMQWQAKGLGEPPSVRAATEAYRSEQDPLRDFLADVCKVDPSQTCSRKGLRDAYEAWVDEAGGRYPITGKDFAARVRKLQGVSEKTIHGSRIWVGIGISSVQGAP